MRRLFLLQRQRGQALVEVVVLAAALIPLLLAIPLIAKYQDIRHASIAASRTAAFECSVRPESCGDRSMQVAVEADLRRRHFGGHDQPLLTQGAATRQSPDGVQNRFWVDRRGLSLLAPPSDVTLDLALGNSDAAAGAWSRRGAEEDSAPGTVLNPMSQAAGPRAFGLEVAGGLVTARVDARVSGERTLAQWLRKPEGIGLSLSGRTAVLVDAWNASGKGGDARSFESRVGQGWRLPGIGSGEAWLLDAAGSAAPEGALASREGVGAEEALDLLYAPVRELISGPLLAPVEPRGALFRYHEIDVDVVPADRLRQP